MYLSAKVLGSTVATAIATKANAPILTIGKDTFYRRDLAALECFNFLAAGRLARVLADLDVRDTRDLFERIPPSALIAPQVGAIALSVLGAAFERKKIGGAAPLEAWMLAHRTGATRELITVHTLKAQAKKQEAGEAKAARARTRHKAARRDQAQRLRGRRYIERRERPRTDVN